MGEQLWPRLGAGNPPPRPRWPLARCSRPPREAPGSARSPPSLPARCRQGRQRRAEAAGTRRPGAGPAPTLGSRRRLLPTARLLLLGCFGCPLPRPPLGSARAGPWPRRAGLPPPAENKRRAKPVSHGLRPSLPEPGQRCGKNTASGQAAPGTGGEAIKLALSSQLLSINRSWPRGRCTAADVPSVRCPAHTVPQDCSAPIAGAQHWVPAGADPPFPHACAARGVSTGTHPLWQTHPQARLVPVAHSWGIPPRWGTASSGGHVPSGGWREQGHIPAGRGSPARCCRSGGCPSRWGGRRKGCCARAAGMGVGERGEPCSHTQPRGCLCEHPGHARLGGAARLFWELSAPPREVSDAFIYKPTGSCPAPAGLHAGKSPTEPRQTEPAASPHGRR